jgi:hypothetical protein
MPPIAPELKVPEEDDDGPPEGRELLLDLGVKLGVGVYE